MAITKMWGWSTSPKRKRGRADRYTNPCVNGVAGLNLTTSGNANGLWGLTQSAQGNAVYLVNSGGGNLIFGTQTNGGSATFSVQGNGGGFFVRGGSTV